jgi:hypothetical protein
MCEWEPSSGTFYSVWIITSGAKSWFGIIIVGFGIFIGFYIGYGMTCWVLTGYGLIGCY